MGERRERKGPPTIIYLQWYGDGDPSDGEPLDPVNEVTWCADQIFERDFEYRLVRKRGERTR